MAAGPQVCPRPPHHAFCASCFSLAFPLCSAPSQNLSPLSPKCALDPASWPSGPLRSEGGETLRTKSRYMLAGGSPSFLPLGVLPQLTSRWCVNVQISKEGLPLKPPAETVYPARSGAEAPQDAALWGGCSGGLRVHRGPLRASTRRQARRPLGSGNMLGKPRPDLPPSGERAPRPGGMLCAEIFPELQAGNHGRWGARPGAGKTHPAVDLICFTTIHALLPSSSVWGRKEVTAGRSRLPGCPRPGQETPVQP